VANPWMKKNPVLSMWLSDANTVAGRARGASAREHSPTTPSASSPTSRPIRAPRLATLLALVERRGQGIGELGATREEATAFASWRGPLSSD
jgi:hypothetical protein